VPLGTVVSMFEIVRLLLERGQEGGCVAGGSPSGDGRYAPPVKGRGRLVTVVFMFETVRLLLEEDRRAGALQLGHYKRLVYFEAVVHESPILSPPPSICIAHPGAILLHDY